MAWLSGWTRRRVKVVENLTIPDYQMKLMVHKSGLGPDTYTDIYLGDHCRSDFADLRFTGPDQVTLLSYWVESITSGVATVWIKVPTLSPINNIYIYYDNPVATSLSSGTNTFKFFDNYDTNAFAAGWTNVAYSLDSTDYCDWGETLAAQNQRREYIRPAGGDSNPAKWCGKRSLVTSTTYNTFAMESKQVSFSPSGGGNHGDMNSMSGFIIFKDNSNRFHIGIGSSAGGGGLNYYIDYFIGGGRTFTGLARSVVPSRIKLTYDGTTIIFYVDEGSGYVQKYSVNIAYSSFNIGLLDQIRYGNCGLIEYTDDFHIRQFVSPEPTFGASGNDELNATAILMTLDKTSCLGPCTINAYVTWHNYGNANITSFTAAILIDSTTLVYGTPISIPAGGDASSGAITTPTLSTGSHTICPYPN